MNTAKFLTARVFLMASAVAATASTSIAPPCLADGPAAPARVPFEMLPSNHMVVSATINGKGPYRLVFDLGAPITLLGNRAGEASGVVKKETPKSFLMGMRGEAKIDAMKVGNLSTEDIPVIVADHPVLKALAGFLGRPLDGIIGYTFFARYKTTIDYQAKQMTFEPVDHKIRDLLASLPDRLAGPKVATERTLAPAGLWGLVVGDPTGGVASPGIPVVAVTPDSPAAAAGLRPGDILTALDGRWTASLTDAYAAAASAPAGPLSVMVLREGKEMTLAVTPREGI